MDDRRERWLNDNTIAVFDEGRTIVLMNYYLKTCIGRLVNLDLAGFMDDKMIFNLLFSISKLKFALLITSVHD